MKVIAENKKAFFNYDILDRLEAGIVLTGDEVKSIRAGQVSLVGSFATIHDGELYLTNCSIVPYKHAAEKRDKEWATRRRKLLVHRRELDRLVGDMSRKGITLVPLKMYFTGRSKIKVEIGLAKHKNAASKRQTLKERDIKRQTDRELKQYK